MSAKKNFSIIQKTACVLLILAVVYVLSIGPVFALHEPTMIGVHDEFYDFTETFYAPLILAIERNALVRNLFTEYLDFCRRFT